MVAQQIQKHSDFKMYNINLITAILVVLPISFLLCVFKNGCCNGKIKKENDKLRRQNDEMKAQFKDGWQKSFLFPDWRKELFQAVNVTLDPDTAHPALILSQERRVTMGEQPQDLPKSQLRFESLPCVLGHQSISSGRHYWEVKVENGTAWDLGICRNNVRRKEKTHISPEDGFWAIRLYNDEYWALTSPETKLTLKNSPSTVCIFLDYEYGSVSFYNMTDKSHIHSFFPGSFSGSLRPFLRLWSKDSGHLDICPLPKEPELAQHDDDPNPPPTVVVHT
ncbi:PREDICTED: butyrophilin subfamily 1 member A1-like [Chinchilla lanigera]|uniref:butyrophilin subfamily 1 member A1-like n=1 Tax=Chinchilla lanigera TaxID=34839 RepID=UPI0006988629|nr:PREDICTED: butyrophilin subfamily 1 member A1-like [Chinchilla lanigera]